MPIVMHFGAGIKAYRELSPGWLPCRCLLCGKGPVRRHDLRPHTGPPGGPRLWLYRYRCRRCGRVFAVLPDGMLVGCRYPASVRDAAVEAYVTGQGTYLAIATEIGVSPSTVWRWVHALTGRAARWLAWARAWLRSLGVSVGPIRFRDDLRALFLGRGVRRPGMLEGLLTAEALMVWLDQLRRVLLERGGGPLATGLWAFGVHVLERMGGTGVPSGP
jgi:transposase-like protein